MGTGALVLPVLIDSTSHTKKNDEEALPMRILVVEDDPPLRDFLRKGLEQEHHAR